MSAIKRNENTLPKQIENLFHQEELHHFNLSINFIQSLYN